MIYYGGGKILNNASALIAVSDVEFEQYKKLGVDESQISIVPNGVDLEKFGKNSCHGKFKLEQGITTEHIILYMGRIHKIKGLKFLIEAFRQVLHDIGDVTLIIAGPDDGYRTELENMVKSLKIKNIKFIGYVQNVFEAYSDADILVYPAIYEIFGLVPFEAIASGTPIIVTQDCGCGELVKKSGSGYLVKYGDVQDLSEKIEYILRNPDKQLDFLENGKNFILNNLRWDIICKNVEKIYNSI